MDSVCCENCFADHVLQDKVREEGAIGDCSRCGSTGVATISPGELTGIFEPVIGLYHVSSIGVDRTPDEDAWASGQSLTDCVQEDWDVFSELLLGLDGMSDLLDDIVNWQRSRGRPQDRIELEVNDAWVPYSKDFIYRGPDDYWGTFAYHIRNVRRFIPDESESGVIPPQDWLPEFIADSGATLKVGTTWYRCRDSTDNSGIGRDQALPLASMGAPPREKARAGRANPVGIPFLYLSSDAETAVAETRAWKGQKVSVATFKLGRDLLIADLTKIPYLTSPFGISEGLLPWLIERIEIIGRLASDLSQPVDPGASDVEYLLTQYLTELILSQGYSGMLYKSAMGRGTNLVLFDNEAATPISSDLVEVSDVQYALEIKSSRLN